MRKRSTSQRFTSEGIPLYRSFARDGRVIFVTIPGPETHSDVCTRDAVFGPDPDCERCVSLGRYVELHA